MSQQRFRRAKEVFAAARRRPAEERTAFVAEACAGDSDLRQEVDSLLDFHRRDRGPLEAAGAAEAQQLGDIGPYRLARLLGRGGMGEVYEAEQRSPIRRRVALKVIRGGLDSEQVVARFESERQALALMSHPGIAAVLDAATTEDGRPYFVMELVQGSPILDYCDANGLDSNERLELFATVCRAVQHAHERGIIHRDIKSSNVLVAEQDGRAVAKLIDFGIAKAIGPAVHELGPQTVTGQLLGTPESMSPEQTELGTAIVDHRSDVYSLGALLYHLLSGSAPFDVDAAGAAGFDELRRVIREQQPVPPSQLLPSLDSDLDWIVLKALAKEPTRRYSSADELADDIERHLRRQPIRARPPSRAYQLRKAIERRRGLVIAVTLAVVAMLIGVIATFLTLRQPQTAIEDDQRAQALYEQGRQQLRLDSPAAISEAITLFERSIALDQGHASAHARLAEALLALSRRGDLPMAEAEQRAGAAVERALAIDDDSSLAHAVLGLLRHSIGDMVTADSALERALQLDPELASAHLWLGNLRAAQNLNDEAVSAYRRALALDPLDLTAHDALSSVLLNQGRYDDAMIQFSRRLRIEDDSAETYRLMALWARTYGHLADAVRWARRAVELDPEAPLNLHELAMASSKLGDLGAADDAVGRALELAPNNHWTVAVKTFYLIDRGDFEELERFTQGQLERFPDSVDPLGIAQDRRVRLALAALSKLYRHDDEASVAYFEQAMRGATADVLEIGLDADFWSYLALSYRRLGRRLDAERAAGRSRELIERRQDWIWSHLIMPETVAALLALEGRHDEAMATLKQAVADGWTDYWALIRSPRFDSLRDRGDYRALQRELEQRLTEQRSLLTDPQPSSSRP